MLNHGKTKISIGCLAFFKIKINKEEARHAKIGEGCFSIVERPPSW
jgi:hypothetical protein